MKDLKHLIFFENLLQDAQNELVTKAISEGQHALGYNCYYVPETLLNLPVTGAESSYTQLRTRVKIKRNEADGAFYGEGLIP